MEARFYKSPLLRYYKAYTLTGQSNCELLIRMHSNKLFLVFLHPNHPVMQQNVLEVSYKFNTDALSGKRKKGASNMQANTVLLEVKTSLQSYSLRAAVPGKLIETNEELISNPNLIKDPEGYLAIIMPPLSKVEAVLKTLTPL